jgi:hypothetical protein
MINLIQAELEESMKHGVEDIVVCVNQRTQGLCKDCNKSNNEKQVDLQAVKTSLDMQTKSLQETLAYTRNNLHKELGLMFQVKAKTTKAQAKPRRGTGTGAGAAKPPKFDRSISRGVFRHQFNTVADTTAGRTWRNPHTWTPP